MLPAASQLVSTGLKKKKLVSTFSVLPVGNTTKTLTSGLKTCPASVLKSVQFLVSVVPWLLSRDYKLSGRVSRVSRQRTKDFLSEFPRVSYQQVVLGAAAHSSGKLILVLPLVVPSSASWVSFSHSANI